MISVIGYLVLIALAAASFQGFRVAMIEKKGNKSAEETGKEKSLLNDLLVITGMLFATLVTMWYFGEGFAWFALLIMLMVALAQIFKVIDLAKAISGKSDYYPTEADNRLNGRIFLIFMFAFFGFSIWNVTEYKDRLLPVAASAHGVEIDKLLYFNFAIIWLVFFLTNALLFIFAWKYYGRKDSKASYFAHDNKLEMLWTVIPSVVLAIIIVWGLKKWNEITAVSTDPKAVKIELYAQQFNWTARYAGVDGKLGESNYLHINGKNEMGLDTNDVVNFDDIVVKNEIHIPVNREVSLQFRSRDVIHSAYMPHFRLQMNCVPGQVTYFRFTPTITTKEMRGREEIVKYMEGINKARELRGDKPEEFNYMLLCNKICGASHYNMPMIVVVDSEAEYQAWLKSQKGQFKLASTK